MLGRLTTTEAARLAGMSPERLIRRLVLQQIDGELVAGRWLVETKSLASYIAREQKHGRTLVAGR